jgi:hypothetical protein
MADKPRWKQIRDEEAAQIRAGQDTKDDTVPYGPNAGLPEPKKKTITAAEIVPPFGRGISHTTSKVGKQVRKQMADEARKKRK